MASRNALSVMRPVSGLFARQAAPMAATRAHNKSFSRYMSKSDPNDGLILDFTIDHKKLIDNAIAQLKHASAVAQLKPGAKAPAAPNITDPIKESVLAEVKAEAKAFVDNYEKKFLISDEQYQKNLETFRTEKTRLKLDGIDFPLPSQETSWKEIMEG